GHETLRRPVLLRRGEEARVQVEMLAEGSTPEGLVWIPPGPFLSGGGLGAIGSVEESLREMPGFWISRDEVTVGEYAEFLNDPSILAEVRESGLRGSVTRVPRGEDLPGGPWKPEEGRYVPAQDPRWPVLGVSWEDADAYCRWRTTKERTGDRGRAYDLPTEEEWCKAARGVDGRDFPWGSEFDWSFCLGGWFPPESKRPEPVGRHVRGASVWEVMDVEAGGREWCSGWTDEGQTHHPNRGGSWAHRSALAFHVEHRSGSPPSEASRYTGFRVVLRPAPPTPPR
ncbi:MAG: formylglycine-generating enzyme family protein, partial [Planctomycetota bacterium]